MTIKEASLKFGIEEKELRNRKKDGMIIGCRTINRRIFIPDETKIIPSKKDVQFAVLQIVKYKNNKNVVLSRQLYPDEKTMKVFFDYLYLMGIIGEYSFCSDINKLFDSIQITDDGLKFLIGESRLTLIDASGNIPLVINPEVKIGIINL